MKSIIAVGIVTLLTGCAAVDRVKEIWPRAHDPALVSGFVSLQVNLEKIDCTKKETIEPASKDADWLNRYAEFRKDPQKISTKGIVDNLQKAKESNESACHRWVNLSKTRMKIIQEAWSGR